MTDPFSARPILFISAMESSPWGGCEELWSATAILLKEAGWNVIASVKRYPILHARLQDLKTRGIDLRSRPVSPFSDKVRRAIHRPYLSGPTFNVAKTFRNLSPALVVISAGSIMPDLDLLELCMRKNWPTVTLSHANRIDNWPNDLEAERYRAVFRRLRKCFFVSHGNLEMARIQFAYNFLGAEIVRNPVHPEVSGKIAWPQISADDELRMACVGRLEPVDKGQDILFDVLSREPWTDRRWSLTLYGEGSRAEGLKKLAHALNIGSRVRFAGQVKADQPWRDHHVLVLPSRCEGLPLTIIEAMLCGRPVVTTDIAGNAEPLDDGRTGFIAEAPERRALARAMEALWEKRSILQTMGEAAAIQARQLLCDDPVRAFCRKLEALATAANSIEQNILAAD